MPRTYFPNGILAEDCGKRRTLATTTEEEDAVEYSQFLAASQILTGLDADEDWDVLDAQFQDN